MVDRHAEYILGLLGAIFGLVGTLIWLFVDSFIWGSFIDGFRGINLDSDDISEGSLNIGIILSIIQSILLISFYIVALVKALPSNLQKNHRKSGFWILFIGIGTTIFNFFMLLPGILLIISGSLALREKKGEEVYQGIGNEFSN
ncbi:hypothetical protein [Bacillus sp. RAR_GA_16]|uniref:hypothetical protein n=1 Tax=Bacillus sp. RAR_GA_16 TaxID=2876774 RepID=UPI001CCD1908|nr:hypothetical protein [Bacillus sp. RAR_GA_16]MCA0171922.1 hypothetical protein [Bacillus sp. RAR_GA_16]